MAFCYLEWLRARQLARPELDDKAKSWWRCQRAYGLGRAALGRAEEHDLAKLLRWSGSQAGLKRLRRALRRALPLEYRQTG